CYAELFWGGSEIKGIAAKTEQRPQFLSNVRHKGMQQSQNCREDKIHHRHRRFLFRFVRAENVSLSRFNKPVAVITPDKIVEMLGDHVELIFAIRGLYYVDCLIEPREHFDGKDR